jgi:hypothetical protein
MIKLIGLCPEQRHMATQNVDKLYFTGIICLILPNAHAIMGCQRKLCPHVTLVDALLIKAGVLAFDTQFSFH